MCVCDVLSLSRIVYAYWFNVTACLPWIRLARDGEFSSPSQSPRPQVKVVKWGPWGMGNGESHGCRKLSMVNEQPIWFAIDCRCKFLTRLFSAVVWSKIEGPRILWKAIPRWIICWNIDLNHLKTSTCSAAKTLVFEGPLDCEMTCQLKKHRKLQCKAHTKGLLRIQDCTSWDESKERFFGSSIWSCTSKYFWLSAT